MNVLQPGAYYARAGQGLWLRIFNTFAYAGNSLNETRYQIGAKKAIGTTGTSHIWRQRRDHRDSPLPLFQEMGDRDGHKTQRTRPRSKDGRPRGAAPTPCALRRPWTPRASFPNRCRGGVCLSRRSCGEGGPLPRAVRLKDAGGDQPRPYFESPRPHWGRGIG